MVSEFRARNGKASAVRLQNTDYLPKQLHNPTTSDEWGKNQLLDEDKEDN
jgi:hypothetical protein